MKHLILLLAFFISATTFAQKVSITFLMNIANCADYSCFEDSALSKKFSYYNTVDGSAGKTVTYQSNKNDATKSNNLSLIIYDRTNDHNVRSEASISTYSSVYYNTLKQQLRTNQFIAGKPFTDETTGMISTRYDSRRFPRYTIWTRVTNLAPMGFNLVLYAVAVQRLL